MNIIYLEEIDSTQNYLIKEIKNQNLKSPSLVIAKRQTKARGSRENSWQSIEGNLFFSFSYKEKDLPNDLAQNSVSVFFAFILKKVLKAYGSKLWLKWPNDFYIEEKKIGGVMTNKISSSYVCGIGINTKIAPKGFGKLDIKIDERELLKKFFKNIENIKKWKDILKEYKLEFYMNKKFSTNLNDNKISLENAKLLDDASIEINGERIYNLR